MMQHQGHIPLFQGDMLVLIRDEEGAEGERGVAYFLGHDERVVFSPFTSRLSGLLPRLAELARKGQVFSL